MKNALVILFLICLTHVRSQSPNWAWAKNQSAAGNEEGAKVQTDSNGNVYAVGNFTHKTLVLGTYTLTNSDTIAGYREVYVVKYDSIGNILWAKSFGGGESEQAMDLLIDKNDNLIITGLFTSSVVTCGSNTLACNGYADIYVVKMTSAGNYLWARSYGGSGVEIASGLSMNKNGSVFLTGSFTTPSLAMGSFTITSNGNRDFFIAKLDGLGNISWIKSNGGIDDDISSDISVDNNSNVIITGGFSSNTMAFSTTTITNTAAFGTSKDCFIAKYDSTGNFIWAKSGGGGWNYNDEGVALSSDKKGNIYLMGSFSSATFTLGTIVLTNIIASNWNTFIAKYNSNGNVVWVNNLNLSHNGGWDVTNDSIGDVYAIGNFADPTLTLGTTTLVNNGSYDIFITKCDTLGNYLWAKNIGGTVWDYANGISVDNKGNVYVTGDYINSSCAFGTTILNNSGLSDGFVAKLSNYTSTNVEKIELEIKHSIYPNPSKGFFNLSSNDISDNSEIILFNNLGQTLSQQKIQYGINVINTSQFNPGLYHYKIVDDKKQSTVGKIIIE